MTTTKQQFPKRRFSKQWLRSEGRPRSGRLRIIGAALGTTAALLSFAAVPALAAAAPSSQQILAGASVSHGLSLASPYGEVAHFGGFDGTGKISGKFDYPVGFAVAAEESTNYVYVLDRVVNEENGAGPGKLGYRLQKLSSSGAPIASVTLPVEEFASRSAAHPLVSLAVDPAKGRVYALVESVVESGEEGEGEVPVAQRIVAWSTKPSGTTLVKAPGYTSEDSVTHAALVAEVSPGELSSDLYSPQGLTVLASHDVVIEAQQGVSNAAGGPTTLQQVEPESPKGTLGESWVASGTGNVAPHNQQADGVFTAGSGGSIGIDLYERHGKISRLADVSANFKAPNPSLLAEDTSGGKNRDEAPSIDNEFTVNYHGEESDERILVPYTAGSPITQLTNGLYAARYAQIGKQEELDEQSQIEPWNGAFNFWYQGSFGNARIANEGIRLFAANGSVVTTIGGQPAAPCFINTAAVSVAAGSAETLFVLTQPNEANGNSGDEVIEFKPGGKGACPQPTGSLTVNGKAGSSFSFPAGTKVTLADSVERKGEAPYRFDWGLLNSSTFEAEDLKTQIEAPEYKWPAPSTSHTFTKKGTYYLAATLYGDYGVTEIGGVVTIKIT
jgi:hypothetical protein